MEAIDVVVVGAGFSGLSAAYYLQRKGLNVKVLEVSSQVGGRARSDKFEGYTLDRGLHFYHHSTTELSKIININELALKNSYPGYLLRYQGTFNLFTNPIYQTIDTVSTALAKNASFSDKMRLFGLYVKLKTTSYNQLVKEKESSTFEYLSKNGFSKRLIDSFFRPMIAANIFDYNLQSSSRFSKIYLKSLFQDHVALPKEGIGKIAESIARKLEPGSICFKTKVKRVLDNGVEFINGDFLEARFVVVATNAIDANLIMGDKVMPAECSHVSTLYFSTEKPPVSKPVVMLNGDEGGLVNHVFLPTLLHPEYAPKGKHLVAVNIIKEHDLDDDELVVRSLTELSEWFGLKVMDWHHLKTYHIKYAMPFKPILDEVRFSKKISSTVYACGDGLSVGSMESALRSGRETADLIAQEFIKGRYQTPDMAASN
ncbi:MAG: FAD-dependent oxidoreductase [Sphingobacteriales bacterium]|nr:FAD-dependent oxidoreductase [Sphingobacteriales bacterium]